MRKLSYLAIALFLIVTACTKIESTTIGSGLIPPTDGVITLDTTLDVFTNSFEDTRGDSVKVFKTEDQVIGQITSDPIFGKTIAKSFFELKPTKFKYSFPAKTTLRADSAVLILSYKGYYGDVNSNQQWEVRELTEKIKEDSTYNTSSTFTTGGILSLSPKTISIAESSDSVRYDPFEKAKNQIRIRLTDQFAKRLIELYDSTANKPYESDSLFRLAFKGFAVCRLVLQEIH
jgi:hypothetical protein